MTADKDVVSKDPADDDTYTITLSVQGNKTTASTAVDSDVVLVVDTSSSMYNSRLSTAKDAALKFADELLGTGKNNRVAVIGFGCRNSNGGENDSTAIRFSCDLKAAEDKKTVEDTINSIETTSNGIGTNYTAALAKAKKLLDDADGSREGVVVFITDGAPGYYSEYDYWNTSNFNGKTQAAAIKDSYDLYTIGINIRGTDLTNLNALSSGEDYHYNVTDENMDVQLPAILTKIAYRINDVPAGTDVIMTDEINPAYFEVVGDADDVEIKPATACDVSITDGKVILKFDEMPEETVTCYIKVKVKDNVLLTEAKKDVPTNTGVTLEYKDPDGAPEEMDEDEIGHPTVDIPANAAKVTVKYVDEAGRSIHADLTGDVKFGETVNADSTLGTTAVKQSITGYVYKESEPATGIQVEENGSNVLTMVYQSNTLSVTYDDGVSDTSVTNMPMPNPDSVDYGEDYTVSSTEPTRTGYTFTGWKFNNSTTTYQASGTIENVTSDITLTAQWRVRSDLSYTVNYLDKDTNRSIKDAETNGGQTYGATIEVGAGKNVVPPAIDGYVFDRADKNSITIDTGSNVINLYYEKVYTLTYDANGGSWNDGTNTVQTKTDATKYPKSSTPVSLTESAPDNARPAVSTDGTNVVFIGWSTTKQDKIYKNGDTVPTIVDSVTFSNADITVYAVWGYDDVGRSNDPANPNVPDNNPDVFQAVVTYQVKNGTWQGNTEHPTEIKQVYDRYKKENGVWTKQNPVLANVPTPTPATGYTNAVTWTKNSVSCAAPKNGDDVTGNVTYTATFSTLKTYTVKYYLEGGTGTFNDQTKTHGVPLTLYSDTPTMDGYTFAYWKDKNGVPYAASSEYKEDKDLDLYAQWNDAYKLIYKDTVVTTNADVTEKHHDASVPLKVIGSADGQINFTAPAAGEGHKDVVFVGWSETNYNKIFSHEDTTKPVLVTSVSFNAQNTSKTVYAVWSYDDIGNGPSGPDGSDNKPDVFQATVTYKVTNGTFVGGGTEKKVVFDLKEKKDGVWTALNPKLGDKTIPTPVAAEGYTDGEWAPTFINEDTQVTGNTTYTYAFVLSSITVDPTDPDGKSDTDDAWVKKQLTVRGSGFRSETFTVTVTPVVADGESAGNISTEIGGSFEVVSTSYTGKVEMTGSGTEAFVFDKDNHITFTKAGKYTFTVKETAGTTRGMTYDTTEYTLEVNVVEGQNGLELGEVKTVTVKNSYYRASSSGSSGAVAKLEKGTHFNYVMGYSDGTIRPNKEITRGEVAIIFFRLLTDESRKEFYSEHNDFTDVPEDSKSNIAISTLTNAGVIGGYADGTFRPNAKVTRGQLAAIIARFADMKGNVDKTFTDIDTHWAKDLILLAASNGWIDGYGDGTFRPNANITRAQTMKIINLALDRNVTSEEDLLDQDEMNVWVDNMDPDAWYYYHVQEASNNHAYVRKQAGSIDEKWTAKLEDIDWSVYQF